jgi:hypothetical protein
VKIILRGDSGFCRNELMSWCENNSVDFVFGLARKYADSSVAGLEFRVWRGDKPFRPSCWMGLNAGGIQQAFIGTASSVAEIPVPGPARANCLNNSGVVFGVAHQADGFGTPPMDFGFSIIWPPGWSIDGAISISQNSLVLAGYRGGHTTVGPGEYLELDPNAMTH